MVRCESYSSRYTHTCDFAAMDIRLGNRHSALQFVAEAFSSVRWTHFAKSLYKLARNASKCARFINFLHAFPRVSLLFAWNHWQFLFFLHSRQTFWRFSSIFGWKLQSFFDVWFICKCSGQLSKYLTHFDQSQKSKVYTTHIMPLLCDPII